MIFLEMPDKNMTVLLQTQWPGACLLSSQKNPKFTPCLEVRLIILGRSESPNVRSYR